MKKRKLNIHSFFDSLGKTADELKKPKIQYKKPTAEYDAMMLAKQKERQKEITISKDDFTPYSEVDPDIEKEIN